MHTPDHEPTVNDRWAAERDAERAREELANAAPYLDAIRQHRIENGLSPFAPDTRHNQDLNDLLDGDTGAIVTDLGQLADELFDGIR